MNVFTHTTFVIVLASGLVGGLVAQERPQRPDRRGPPQVERPQVERGQRARERAEPTREQMEKRIQALQKQLREMRQAEKGRAGRGQAQQGRQGQRGRMAPRARGAEPILPPEVRERLRQRFEQMQKNRAAGPRQGARPQGGLMERQRFDRNRVEGFRGRQGRPPFAERGNAPRGGALQRGRGPQRAGQGPRQGQRQCLRQRQGPMVPPELREEIRERLEAWRDRQGPAPERRGAQAGRARRRA